MPSQRKKLLPNPITYHSLKGWASALALSNLYNMAQYVTLEELKQHLNVDFDTDDAYITGLIEPVQLLIESYLNNPLDTYVKDAKIDRRIWHAIRILIANYYANRESVTFATPQVIPGHIELLLQPLKRYT